MLLPMKQNEREKEYYPMKSLEPNFFKTVMLSLF